MSLGRADVGSPADLADLEVFRRHRLIRESLAGWESLDGALRAAYDSPEAVAADLDEAVRDEGWWPLYETGLGSVWNARYAAAGGH